MIKKSDDEILKWYQTFQDWKSSGMKLPEFCRMHNVNPDHLNNMRRVIYFKRDSNPELHARLINIIRQVREQGITRNQACEMYGVTSSLLTETVSYLSYQETLKRIHEERNLPFNEEVIPVQFIEVSKTPKAKPKQGLNDLLKQKFEPVMEPEIIEKKNDIELIISKGVRVIVSPDLGAEKLIKIIELLKDL